MRYKKYRKNGEQRFVKYLVRIIITLIFLMLVLVVHDRYVFHKQVYDCAITEINAHKKAYADSAALDSLNRSGLFVDTISKPVQISAFSSDARNHNEMSQTVNINNPNPIKQITEDITSTIDTLKDTDGLISANGITYLISLIVALLIALVSDRVIEMEKLMTETRVLNANLEKEMPILKKLNSETQKEIQWIKTNNTSFYSHSTNYNNLLNRIESLYNHTIIFDITLSSTGVNDKTLDVIDLLNSRINIIYDSIMNRLDNKEYRLDYMTIDEKSLLSTYIEDALLCLNEKLPTVIKMNDDYLLGIIQDKINIIEEIRDKIDTIEIKVNIYTS